MRKHFYLADSHANVLVAFAEAVKAAGGTCETRVIDQPDPSARSGQLVEADWPDNARAVTDRWESMRASKLVVDA